MEISWLVGVCIAGSESPEKHTRAISVKSVLNDASKRASKVRPVTDNALGIGTVVGIVGKARSDSSGLGKGCRIEGSADGEFRMTMGTVSADRSVTVVASVA